MQATFKDSTDRKWNIELPFGEAKRVKHESEGRFDLLDSKELPKLLQEDLAEFWELLWHVIEPQAVAAGIGAEQFGKEMTPALVMEARDQFFKVWADFFRSLRREEVAIALEKMAAYTVQGIEMVRQKLSPEQLLEVDTKTLAKMQTKLNEEFGNLLASLE